MQRDASTNTTSLWRIEHSEDIDQRKKLSRWPGAASKIDQRGDRCYRDVADAVRSVDGIPQPSDECPVREKLGR